MNSFEARVTDIKRFGEHVIAVVKCDEGKFTQYCDLKWPAAEDPGLEVGEDIKVSYGYLPTARGYQSNKLNPKTNEPYINSVLVFWKPKVESEKAEYVDATPDDESIPF